MSDTRAFLLAHAAAYPALTLTDLFKALYQSAFGCEHLVADPSAAEAYIAAEAEGARPCGRERRAAGRAVCPRSSGYAEKGAERPNAGAPVRPFRRASGRRAGRI